MSFILKRQERLRKLIKKSECAAMLVTCPLNVFYLTGFTGGDSYLYLDGERLLLLSDARYEQQIGEECPELETHIRPSSLSLIEETVKVLPKLTGSVLIESDVMTVGQYHYLKDHLAAIQLGLSNGLVEQLREIKDPSEMSRIRRAVTMAERAFIGLRQAMRPEWSEEMVANFLDASIRQLGGKGTSFSPIVGVGERAALPHGVPSTRLIGSAPFVLVDWGANEGAYLSDLTRVLVTSRIPPKFARAYHAVLEAHQAAAAALRPGAIRSEVDQIARKTLDQAGLGKRFTHGLGHGFGLKIHESPRLAKNQDLPLSEGMVVTIEPGIYIPGWGGIRLEDDYWITEDGCERLSHLPQSLDDNRVEFL